MCKKHIEAWRRTNRPVDAAIVRDHINQLRQAGFGYRRIAELSGCGTSTIRALSAGDTTYTYSDRAAAILAVDVERDLPLNMNPIGAMRRLRALIALGYTDVDLADRLGTTQTNIWRYTGTERSYITLGMHQRIDRLYRELGALPQPNGWIADRARRRAAKRGWLPPMAWDDDMIDQLDGQPADYGRTPAAKRMRAIPPDFIAEYVDLRDEIGLSDAKIAARLGITEQALYKRLLRAVIPAQSDEQTEVAS